MFSIPKRNYNNQVLLGEWFENKCMNEYKLALYLKKKERKNLLVNKIRKLFDIFLKEVPLALPSKGLAYGGTIQLLGTIHPLSTLAQLGDNSSLLVLFSKLQMCQERTQIRTTKMV